MAHMALKTLAQRLFTKAGLRVTRIPQFINPIAPFDLLELAVERELLKRDGDFYFVHFGFPDPAPGLSMAFVVRKFGLRGCIVGSAKPHHDQPETMSFDPLKFDFVELEFEQDRLPSMAGMIANLPAKPISLLSLRAFSHNKSLVGAAFDADLYPPIINLERTEMNSETIHSLKITLLDNGYRFIDVGVDTICLRLESD